MMNEKYYVELDKLNKLLERKNKKTDFYNGIYDRYEYPVLTREMIPLTWRYDLNPETNPYFIERLGVNAVMNSGAIYLNGKYYLVARIEGNDRKSFFGVAESDNGIDGFRFWDYPILLDDVCPEETNVYDMRLTQHEDGWIYGVFCSESKFICTSSFQNNIERCFFFSSSSTSGRSGSNSNSCSSRFNTIFVFQNLSKFVYFLYGQVN